MWVLGTVLLPCQHHTSTAHTVGAAPHFCHTRCILGLVTYIHRRGEYKAEVALLSRRITFTSDATSTSTLTGARTGGGGARPGYGLTPPCDLLPATVLSKPGVL